MDGLSAAASVFAILQATATAIGYLKDVKDAPKECARCVAEASNLHNLLNNLLFHLNQRRDGDEAWFTSIRALTVENGPLDQYKQALEQLLSKVEIEDGKQKMKRRLVWKFAKGEVDRILQRITRLNSLVIVALGTDHFKLSQAIKDDTTIVRNTLPSLETKTDTIKDAQSEQQSQAILLWLSPTDFPAQQHDIVSKKQGGTAKWFLESTEFKSWVAGKEGTLLCPGIPGAGKTMMAAIAISHLYQTQQANDVGIAYVFCSYKAKFEQSGSSLAAALLKQLVQRRTDLMAPVKDIYDGYRGGKAPSHEIHAALQRVCTAYRTVYLVVDALDEFEDREGIHTEFIDDLLQLQTVADVRILFTSRFIPAITDRFASNTTLEVRASEEDVERFVQGQLPRLPACIRRDMDLQDSIVSRITEAADGMFLLAQLHVKSLYDKRNRSSVLATLERISRNSGTLDEVYFEAYDEAIERIDSQSANDRSLARHAICWISHAQRQLTTTELICALAIEPGDRDLNRDNLYDIEDVTSVCAGLIIVDEDSSVVRLVHYTTQEYFERKRLEWNSTTTAQESIATACLTYLSFDQFRSGSCEDDETFELRLAQNSFYEYSARFWGEHIRPVQDTPVSALASAFLLDGCLVDSALQSKSAIFAHEGYSQSFTRGFTGLHVTILHDLRALTSLLIKNGVLDPNAKDEHGETPLLLASAYGNETIAKLLLETSKVEVNSKNNHGWTPLMAAAQLGQGAVVKLLLETGKAEVESKEDVDGLTARLLAEENGHKEVVDLLQNHADSQ